MRPAILLFGIILLFPVLATAHSNITLKQVVDGTYIVHLTAVPVSPFPGETQKNVLAISDIQERLISQDFEASVTVNKYEGEEIYSKTGLKGEGGLLPFKVTYPEEGLYEIFITFRYPSGVGEYSPEHFVIQVRDVPVRKNVNYTPLILISIFVGWSLRAIAKRTT